jgi:RNA polymerase sigma-70 factor, ECF subfamily
VAGSDLSPSGMILAREQAQKLQGALERLPDDYRQVLLLRYQEQRAFEEIAEQMNRSANAVRKLWMRAVERLQDEMREAP